MSNSDTSNQRLTDAELKEVVNRFLGWRLPDDFSPDCYISFDKENANPNFWPVGTNLLTAEQALAMFRHCFRKDTKEGVAVSPSVPPKLVDPNRQHVNPAILNLGQLAKEANALVKDGFICDRPDCSCKESIENFQHACTPETIAGLVELATEVAIQRETRAIRGLPLDWLPIDIISKRLKLWR